MIRKDIGEKEYMDGEANQKGFTVFESGRFEVFTRKEYKYWDSLYFDQDWGVQYVYSEGVRYEKEEASKREVELKERLAE